MREETSFSFKISSPTLSAEEISKRLDLKPDQSWRIGAVRGSFGSVEKQHGFVLDSNLGLSETVEAHIKAMLKRLAPCASKVSALGTDLTIEFSLIIHRKKAPLIHFDREDLRAIAVMGAVLDIDMFVITDQPRAAAPSGPAAPKAFDA